MNIKFKFIVILLILFTDAIHSLQANYDLTIIGDCDDGGSIPKIPLSLIELLKNDLKINFMPTKIIDPKFISDDLLIKNNEAGDVALLIDMLSRNNKDTYKLVPNSKIKIAYSMLESTRIPDKWVAILNENFDAVVVPDNFLIDVYKNSGVNIPIFVIPVIIHIDEFLKKSIKIKSNNRFVFGCSTVNYPRKNTELLIKAFAKAFKNNSKVMLKIHTKNNLYINELKNLIKDAKTNNIILIEKRLLWDEYVNFISSLDCYVLLSKGEGFSITPREALAAGIPCILSNNTTHKTICDTGFVYSVPSNIAEDAYYPVFKQNCGKHYNCKIDDAVFALNTVFKNYNIYINKAKEGKTWVQQYTGEKLKNKYLNLIKPRKIILGEENKVTDDYLMTSSVTLYHKYLSCG